MSTIEVHQVVEDRSDLLRALVDVRASTEPEVNPGDPVLGPAELASEVFTATTSRSTRAFVGFDAGRPVAELVLDDTPQNPTLSNVSWLATHPEHRRRGVARSMLRAILPSEVESGRTSLLLNTLDERGAALAATLGLTPRGDERCSRLRLADADTDELDRWRAEGGTRADGYHLVAIDGSTPDDLVPAVVAANAAMLDAPLDDMEYTPTQPSAAVLRSREASWVARGLRPIRTVALSGDGEGAGYTELFLNSHRPVLAFQGDTGVLPAHRGRGLGRWLKAVNHVRAVAAEPRLEVIETWNAQSNPWMLAINVAMGFRPHQIWTAQQGDLREAVRRLG